MTVLRKKNSMLYINDIFKFREIGVIFIIVRSKIVRKAEAWMDNWSKELNGDIWKTNDFKQTNQNIFIKTDSSVQILGVNVIEINKSKANWVSPFSCSL